MTAHRAAITGLGPVSSIGIGRREFTEALLAGRSGQSDITAFDTTGYQRGQACEVAGFRPEQHLRNLGSADIGRAGAFAAAAARLALADAGLKAEQLQREPVMIAMGTSDGEATEEDRIAAQYVVGGLSGLEAATVIRHAAALSVLVAKELDLPQAELAEIAAACAAGNHAIGLALDAIRSGQVAVAVCGAADAFSRRMFTGFHRVGTLAPDACRPFDADRGGTVVSEGAGVLVLEDLDRARQRDAVVLGEVIGSAVNCDARHPVAPDFDSVAECIRLAHVDARIEPADVDMISAHGTGTPLNDVNEAKAIRKVFGDRPPPVVAVKSMLGHAMGASSALGVIASAVALGAQFLPPTINHRRTDPECALDCVPNFGRPAPIRVVENHGMGFGGSNAVVVIGQAR